MKTRSASLPFTLSFLLLAACRTKETRTPQPAVVVPAPSSAVATVAPGSPASEQATHFTAEVVANEEFQRIFAPKLMFRLEPYAGNDSGWTIRITPVSETGGPAVDCIGAVEMPLHGDTKVEIEPPGSGASNDSARRQREFDYVASEPDCKAAWALMNDANYATKLSDKEREEASAKLGQISTRHGKF